MKSWSSALSYAPFVLGLVACGSSEDGASQPNPDASAADALPANTTDSGFVVLTDTGVDGGLDSGETPCEYPAGAVEPMQLNEVLSPYSWASAFDAAGRALSLDLTQIHCNIDPSFDWSPFDLLLFVSIPEF